MSAAATSSRPVLETAGGAGGTRTPGQRIMRGMLPSVMRATCTDAMRDSYECTQNPGITGPPVPRPPGVRRVSCTNLVSVGGMPSVEEPPRDNRPPACEPGRPLQSWTNSPPPSGPACAASSTGPRPSADSSPRPDSASNPNRHTTRPRPFNFCNPTAIREKGTHNLASRQLPAAGMVRYYLAAVVTASAI